MTQIHTSVYALEEANKEVLLGKRKLNCLSCGKDEAKQTNIIGDDGRVYR